MTEMKMFQVVFQTGRVQSLMADGWTRDKDVIRFRVDGKESEVFPVRDLIMIDHVDSQGRAFDGQEQISQELEAPLAQAEASKL